VAALCAAMLGAVLCISRPAGAAGYPDQPAVGAGLVCLSHAGLTCFDRSTMDRKWSALPGDHTFDPVVTPSLVLAGGASGLRALSAASGEPRWHWYRGDDVFSPATDSGTVFATDRGGRVAAIDIDSGGVRWWRQLEGWLYTPALVGELVITGGRAGILYALDRDTGEIIWRHELDQELVHHPVALDDSVVVTTFKGTTARLDRQGGTIWQKRDPSPSFSPAAAEGLLVFGGMDGTWRARDVESGRLRWKIKMSGKLKLPARVHTNRVALASPDGNAVIVDSETGEVVERLTIPPAVLGAPIQADPGIWRVFYTDSGIISWSDASQEVK